MVKHNLYLRLLRWTYGVEGVIDEYKLAKLNQIGNNAFLFLVVYTSLAEIGVLFGALAWPLRTVLVSFLVVNALVLLGVGVAMGHAVQRLHFDQIDIDRTDYPGQLRRLRWRALGLGLYTGVLYLVFSVLLWWFRGDTVVAMLMDWKSYVYMVIVGLFTGLGRYAYLKKRVQQR